MMKNQCCTAGFARLDMTPPLGTYMRGYFKARYVKGVLDPLYVRAIAFGEGDRSAVLLVLEMSEFEMGTAERWPVEIAEKLGLPREAVLMCCTHSHTAPGVDMEGSDPQYDVWLLRRLCDAARMALDDRKPVLDVRAGQRETEGLTYSRRYRMKDGSMKGNPPAWTWEDVFKIEKPLGNVDRTLRLVRILRQDAPELLLVNFQSHPDCIGGEYISADFPGAVCRRLEEAVPGAVGVFLQGAMGNMVCTNRTKPLPAYGSKGYNAAMAYGAEVADAALEMYKSLPSVMQGGLAYGQNFARSATKRGKLPLDYCEDIVTRYEKGGLEAVDPDPKVATPIVAEAQVVWRLEQEQLDWVDMPVTVLAFCGLALAGIPGELFSEVGRTIREGSPFPVTCTCSLTNGNCGYLPDLQAIEEGGYDTVCTDLAPGCAELLADTAIELLKKL